MIKSRMEEIIDPEAVTTDDKDEIVIKLPRPIINNDLIISIDEDIEEPSNYRKVFEALRSAKEGDISYLNINSFGGYICTMAQFFHFLLNTKAHTVANVFTAYSAASVIALCCDEINISQFGSIMVHSMSTGTYGKISDVEGYSKFALKQDKDIADTVYQGFLTKAEIIETNKGKEFWMNKKECDSRLKNYKTVKQRFLNKK